MIAKLPGISNGVILVLIRFDSHPPASYLAISDNIHSTAICMALMFELAANNFHPYRRMSSPVDSDNQHVLQVPSHP